jgi:predicted HicB family RNase H-like nuclease
MRTSVPFVPEIRVPITADVHASHVISALKGRYEAKTYIEHLIALNHYTKNFASMIIKDPTLKTYEEVARASRMNVHDYRRSQIKFNARGLAQAKAQTIFDETISRLPNKEAILEFLAQMYKTTLEELRQARHESTPRYEENLRKLFHEASSRAIAECMTSGASSHEEMLNSSPLYKSICALGAWKAQRMAGLPPRPITTRENYLDELEMYWAFFDPDGKVHAFEFVHAWSWMAGRKVDLRYGEGEKVWFYPEMEIMEI